MTGTMRRACAAIVAAVMAFLLVGAAYADDVADDLAIAMGEDADVDADADEEDAVEYEGVFTDVEATVYYPTGIGSWESDLLQDYAGTLTWVGYPSGVDEDTAYAMGGLGAWTVTLSNAGSYAAFSYTPEESGTYRFFTLFTDDIADTVVYLLDAQGGLLALSDGSDFGDNAYLSVELAAGETYFVVFGASDATATGTFTAVATTSDYYDYLNADLIEAALPVTAAGTYEVTVAEGLKAAYVAFTPDTAGTYLITCDFGEEGTSGWVYDAAWSLLASDKASSDEENVNVAMTVELEAGETCYIEVTDRYGSEEGDVLVVVIEAVEADEGEAAAAEEEADGSHADVLAYATLVTEGDVAYTGTVSGGFFYYIFTPEEAGTYVFTTVGEAHTCIYLWDGDWNLLEVDDEGEDGVNALVSAYIEEGETYYVAFGLADGDTSTVEIVMEFLRDWTALDLANAQERAYELTTEIIWNVVKETASGYTFYAFTPEEDGAYTFYTTGDTDTYIYLFDAAWTQLACNDDAGEGLNASLFAQLTAGETYYLAVSTPYSDEEELSYSVVVDPGAPSGECGATEDDDVTWYFVASEDGSATLVVSGEGAMADWESEAEVPWANYYSQITAIVVEEGVTSVGAYAFSGLWFVESVELADTVQTIGAHAFSSCAALTSISLPASVTSLGQGAFEYCTSLEVVVFKGVAPTFAETVVVEG